MCEQQIRQNVVLTHLLSDGQCDGIQHQVAVTTKVILSYFLRVKLRRYFSYVIKQHTDSYAHV